MKNQESTINCPNCGYQLNVNEIIYHQLDEELKKKYHDELAKEKSKLEQKVSLIDQEKKQLEKEKSELSEKINAEVQEKIKMERKKLESKLRKDIDDEKSEQLKCMQDELDQKSKQLKEFHKAKSEIERLKREKEELKSTLEAELEKEFNEKLQLEKAKLKKIEEDKMLFKLSEKEHVIEQLKNQLQEAQRKAEQGSMQLQGEVQELAIESWLRTSFPFDIVNEIKKGALGADCVQIVHTRNGQQCGSIYYESKRTKGFQKSWIEKFKNDMRVKGANIGVIVTETMPADMLRMGLKDGIWVCSFDEFKGLCAVLRESLIQINNVISSQENKGEKMSILYDYLTSNEFKLQIEAIVEGFTQLQKDLDSERRSMESIWKKREKQINKVLLNTIHMYGSIKGIAGSAIQPIKHLELQQIESSPEESLEEMPA